MIPKKDYAPFIPALTHGTHKTADDSTRVCPICHQRITTGEAMRYDMRPHLRTQPGAYRLDQKPKWVHDDCFPTGDEHTRR